MRIYKVVFFVLNLIVVNHTAILAGDNSILVFSDSTKILKISGDKFLYLLEDKTSNLSFKEVSASGNFVKSLQEVPNLGVTTSTFWLTFRIKNTSPTSSLVIELAQPTIDKVELYTILPGGGFLKEELGQHKDFTERTYNHPNYLFDITIPLNSTYTYYLKIKSGGQIMVPLSLGADKVILESTMVNYLLFGIYFGIIAVMILYNLFVYFAIKDKSYLFYVIYIILIGLTQTSLQGYTFKYLWPHTYWINSYSVILFASLGGIGAIEFFKVFLHTKKQIPSLHKALNVFNYTFLISIGLLIWNLNRISFQIVQLTTAITALYVFFCAYILIRKGSRSAKFFMLAWSILLLGAVLFVLKDYDIVPYNTFTIYSMQIASGLEMVLLSFALADRINILKKEKEASQQQALEALQENNKTLMNLRKTEAHLINNEKMASLGQLSAGIAHEINNPINYVISNINPLKQNICDIFELLEKYNALSDENDLKEKFSGIQQFKKEMEVDVLVGEIELLLSGIHDGARRTAEIIKGMSTFSRSDETGYKSTNLHQCIDSTLIVLNSSIKGKIEVVKEYGNLPMVECNSGKLNQVFLNLLNNAAQAIKSRENVNTKGMIRIQTLLLPDHVQIKISDNGTGISEAHLNKIFDPFFTTKDVGEGTGLGLSIVNNIIKAHNGTINLHSVTGEGTEFVIVLPLVQPL